MTLAEEMAGKHCPPSGCDVDAIVNEVLERAAQVCDNRANAVAGDEGGDQLCEDTADLLAERIRSLKSQT